MADDKLPWRRSASIEATSSDRVRLRAVAISFSPPQNASSRLTLVLCPVMTIERFTTGDFIRRLPNRFCAHPGADSTLPCDPPAHPARPWDGRNGACWQRHDQPPAASWLACGLFAD